MNQTVVDYFIKEGYLLSPELAKKDNLDPKSLHEHMKKKFNEEQPTILNEDMYLVLTQTDASLNINWKEFERARALLEKGSDGKSYYMFLDIMEYNVSPEKREVMDELLGEVSIDPQMTESDVEEETTEEGSVIVLDAYVDLPKKRELQDFVKYFKLRYDAFQKMLRSRPELQDTVSIVRLNESSRGTTLSIIGLVTEKRITSNGNILLEVEDPTGQTRVLINQNREDIFAKGRQIVMDEVIGIKGTSGDKILFANDVVFIDIPSFNELKKAEDEVYAVFISDLHVGSNLFMEEPFKRFIKWLNGESGSKDQKQIAKKVKYLFIGGDLIDGAGIYPGQDEELTIKDVEGQYEFLAGHLAQLRDDLHMIAIGGNHDAIRIAEPQPQLDKIYAKSIWALNNMTITTNPSVVNIHASRDFEGFNVLLYHGYSFHYYSENVDDLRMNGGTHNPENIMRFLLQKRHLAPTHTSTLYIPDTRKDPLVIEKVPDFFFTGHLHRVAATNYKNVTMMAGGCWQDQTPFMTKVGVEADPCKVVLVNLQTRDFKILNFKD